MIACLFAWSPLLDWLSLSLLLQKQALYSINRRWLWNLLTLKLFELELLSSWFVILRCVLASLYEGLFIHWPIQLSVRPSVPWSVHSSVMRFVFRSSKTHVLTAWREKEWRAHKCTGACMRIHTYIAHARSCAHMHAHARTQRARTVQWKPKFTIFRNQKQ